MWEFNGITGSTREQNKDGSEKVPCILGNRGHLEPGGLIVLGCARTVWEDYDNAKRLFKKRGDYEIMCVNDIGAQFKADCIEHIASVHHRMLGAIKRMREEKSQLEDLTTHSILNFPGVTINWRGCVTNGGTSGMFAAKVGIALDFHKIVFCGTGIDNTGHYWDPPVGKDNKTSVFDEAQRIPWREFHRDNEFARDRIRFMSGQLKEVYGEPTHEWVYEPKEVSHGVKS